jgi:hypothetical protein
LRCCLVFRVLSSRYGVPSLAGADGMWRECPTEQDEPIYLPLGIQLSDFLIAMGVFLLFFIVLRMPGKGFVVAPLVLFLLKYLKRGKAPGQHWHWLHGQELLPIAGACSPRPQRYSVW